MGVKLKEIKEALVGKELRLHYDDKVAFVLRVASVEKVAYSEAFYLHGEAEGVCLWCTRTETEALVSSGEFTRSYIGTYRVS